jgi:hypothetical protein
VNARNDNDFEYEATPVSPTAAIMTTAAAHGLICMSSSDLMRLLQQAGGGQANGYAAMANSLDAQSKTIAHQHAFLRELMGDYIGAVKEVGAISRANLEHQRWTAQFAAEQKQFDIKAQLAREAIARESATTTEMLTLAKAAALGVLAKSGPEGATLAAAISQAMPSAGAVTGATPGAPPRERPPVAPAVRAAVSRLSSETIDKVLAAAERPHPRVAGNQSALALFFTLIVEVMDAETLTAIQTEIGMPALTQIFDLMKG